MRSHSVTCHPTQVNTPRLNPSQTGWYSIYLPWRDGRLSCPEWPEYVGISGPKFSVHLLRRDRRLSWPRWPEYVGISGPKLCVVELRSTRRRKCGIPSYDSRWEWLEYSWNSDSWDRSREAPDRRQWWADWTQLERTSVTMWHRSYDTSHDVDWYYVDHSRRTASEQSRARGRALCRRA